MDPHNEYISRRDQWRVRRAALERLFVRLGYWRLSLGILEALLACLAFAVHIVSPWLLLVPLPPLIALLIWNYGIVRRKIYAQRAERFYMDGLRRLDDTWFGTGRTGDQFREPSHIYAEDLDVFGKGSLFELAASARTAAGERTLASWLLAPASLKEVRLRQQSVQELRNKLDLRENFILTGEDVRAELHTEAVAHWGSTPTVHFPVVLRFVALILAVAGLASLLAFLVQRMPLWPFATVLGADVVFIFALRNKTAASIANIDTPAQSLRLLSLLLARLERESFESPQLVSLSAALHIEGLPASRRIAQLGRWVDWLDSSDHLLVKLLRHILLWHEQVAMGIQAWKKANGVHIGKWLAATAKFEALFSLAGLSFDRPGWSFPAVVDRPVPLIEATGLQHPLMAPERCIANDIALSQDLRLLIVSGSNMSGKSTLLRAIGLNVVLAWAGAPVAAKHLRLAPLQLGTSIRVTDSLHDNRSRFFAEISRLRQIVDLTKTPPPVLFLLDELLSGTNSHDRRIGAAGIIRKLLSARAVGLITTHDLALSQIEQDFDSIAANVHFEDRMVDGHMEFDYRLRPGVVTRSNALELMRAVGLEI